MQLSGIVRLACFVLAFGIWLPCVAVAGVLPPVPSPCLEALPADSFSASVTSSGRQRSASDELAKRVLAQRHALRLMLKSRDEAMMRLRLGDNLLATARNEKDAVRRRELLEAGEFHTATGLKLPAWFADSLSEEAPVSLIQEAELEEFSLQDSSLREDLLDLGRCNLLWARLVLLDYETNMATREERFAALRRFFEDVSPDMLTRETGRGRSWGILGAPKGEGLLWQGLLWNAAWLGRTEYLFRKLEESLPSEPFPSDWAQQNLTAGYFWLGCALTPEWEAVRNGKKEADKNPEVRKHALERARNCFMSVPISLYHGDKAILGALMADLTLASDSGQDDSGRTEALREAARLVVLQKGSYFLDETLPLFLYDLVRPFASVSLEEDQWFHALLACGLLRMEKEMVQSGFGYYGGDELWKQEAAEWRYALAPHDGKECPGALCESELWLLYAGWLKDAREEALRKWESGPLPKARSHAAARVACLAVESDSGWWIWWDAERSGYRHDGGPDDWLRENEGQCPAFAAFVQAMEGRRHLSGRAVAEERAERLRLNALFEKARRLPHPASVEMLLNGEQGNLLMRDAGKEMAPDVLNRSFELLMEADRACRDIARGGKEHGQEAGDGRASLKEMLALLENRQETGRMLNRPWRSGLQSTANHVLRSEEIPLTDTLLERIREAFWDRAPDEPPLERDTRLADKLVDASRYNRADNRSVELLDRAAAIYAAVLESGKDVPSPEIQLDMAGTLRQRLRFLTGAEAGGEQARRLLRTALICYDGVLTADGGNGAAHEGKAIMLLEQYARGFLSSEAEAGKTGEEKVEQVVLAEAREHYLLAAGLPAGARADYEWTKILRRVADRVDGPGSGRLRVLADELTMRFLRKKNVRSS